MYFSVVVTSFSSKNVIGEVEYKKYSPKSLKRIPIKFCPLKVNVPTCPDENGPI